MAQTATRMPAIGANPLQKAYDDYHIMADQLVFAEDQVRQLNMVNNDLLRENDFQREKLDKVQRERDRLQAYSIDLTTRLAVIQETIGSAISESRKFAVKPVVPDVPDEHEIAADAAEQLSARAAVANLPHRLPQNRFA